MILIFGSVTGVTSLSAQDPTKEYTKTSLKMGSHFEVIAVDSDSIRALQAIELAYQEIDRIEKLISSWQATSQTTRINKAAGISPVVVDQELYNLIYRCLKISRLTQGAYDISFAGMGDIWEFNGQELEELPDSAQVAVASGLVNYKNVMLDRDQHSVFLTQPGMKIGFGSIGKGYAANRAMEIMKQHGIRSGMINAGGDLISWGKNINHDAWSVGIANPDKDQGIAGWLALEDVALVTSGDYEKFFTFNQQRYGHIIDPRTGYPAMGIKSVSVICPDAELADALATAVYVLGRVEGLQLLNQLTGVEGLLITSDNQMLKSKNLDLSLYTVIE